MMAAGLRATAKALEHAPEPKVGAPVLDPSMIIRESSVLLQINPFSFQQSVLS